MKRCFKRMLTLVMIGVLFLVGTVPCVSAVRGQLLLDDTLILDGRENVTVNEDGSWLVTGPFTLSSPLDYDYRLDRCYLEMTAETDGTFDFEVDMAVSDTEVRNVYVYTEYFGVPLGDSGYTSSVIDIDDICRYRQFMGQWPLTYRVRFTTMTYRPITATETVLKSLRYLPPVYDESGDVNNDGKSNTTDVRDLLAAILGRSSIWLQAADIDGDGALTTADARELLKTVVA